MISIRTAVSSLLLASGVVAQGKDAKAGSQAGALTGFAGLGGGRNFSAPLYSTELLKSVGSGKYPAV
jgi:hypothetical protein